MSKKLLIFLFTIYKIVYPCRKFKEGAYWSHDKLIDKAKTIVLVKAECIKNKKRSNRKPYFKKCILTVIKTIKGNTNKEYKFKIYEEYL